MKKIDLKDLCMVAGAASLAYGLHLIYPPLMFLSLGALLIRLGWPGNEVK